MNLYTYINLKLDPNKVTAKKGKDKTTQLLLADLSHTSIFADTRELLDYLEALTERVRLIDIEQNPQEL